MVTAAEISNRISQVQDLMTQIQSPNSVLWRWMKTSPFQEQIKQFNASLNSALTKSKVSIHFNTAVKNSNNDQGNALLLLLQKDNELKELFENNIDWLEDLNRTFQAEQLKANVPPPNSPPPPPPKVGSGRALPNTPDRSAQNVPINYDEEFDKLIRQMNEAGQILEQPAKAKPPVRPPRSNPPQTTRISEPPPSKPPLPPPRRTSVPPASNAPVPPPRQSMSTSQVPQTVQHKSFDQHDIADINHIENMIEVLLAKLTSKMFKDEMIPTLQFIRSLSNALVQYVKTNNTDMLLKLLAQNQAVITGPEKSDPYAILAQEVKAFHNLVGEKIDKAGVQDICDQLDAAAKVRPVDWQALARRPGAISPMASRPTSIPLQPAPDNSAYKKMDISKLYQQKRTDTSSVSKALRSAAKHVTDVANQDKINERRNQVAAIQELVDNVVNAKTPHDAIVHKRNLYFAMSYLKEDLKKEKLHSSLYDVCNSVIKQIEKDPSIIVIKTYEHEKREYYPGEKDSIGKDALDKTTIMRNLPTKGPKL